MSKAGARPLKKFSRYSLQDALVLEIGGGGRARPRTILNKYPEQLRLYFDEVSIRTLIAIDVDVGSICDVHGDGMNLPFKSNIFDLVSVRSVLEHCPLGFERILKEAHRVLKNKAIITGFVPFLWGYHGDYDSWRFTWTAVEELLIDFKHVQIVPVGGPFSAMANVLSYRPTRWLFKLLEPLIIILDRLIFKVHVKKGKEHTYPTRGYMFMAEKGD